MKLFISQSGEVAQAIALKLKSWLPLVNPEFDVFVSAESIDAGKPWFEEIRLGLKNSEAGIGIFTKENLGSTWMFFEHGAIAIQKNFIPLLCGCEVTDLVKTPASIFQAKIFEETQFLKLISDLNEQCEKPRPQDQFNQLVTELWPGLSKNVINILSTAELKQNEEKKQHSVSQEPPQPTIIKKLEVDTLSSFSYIELQKIFRDATFRVDCLVLSGRNLFSTSVVTALKERIENSNQLCTVRILAMDDYSEGHFVNDRKDMMGIGHFRNDYKRDLDGAREHAKNLADLDPEHKKFDVRFYNLMPTQFYFIVDNFLYLSFVLSIPISQCPVLIFDLSIHTDMAHTFSKHFNHYWESSRFFVSIVAFKKDGTFLMVKNRKRGWEWPSGYIEPKEDPMSSAMREFREESGYDIVDIQEVRVRRHAMGGTFYTGYLGIQQAEISAREMESLDFFAVLPPENKLSFPDERAIFAEVIEDARSQLKIFPAP